MWSRRFRLLAGILNQVFQHLLKNPQSHDGLVVRERRGATEGIDIFENFFSDLLGRTAALRLHNLFQTPAPVALGFNSRRCIRAQLIFYSVGVKQQ